MSISGHTHQFSSAQALITEEQRDRAERWLQDAYAEGRLSELEFDERMGQTLQAKTRADLNRAFLGLVERPDRVGQYLAPSAPRLPANRQPNALAGVAHLSPLVCSFFGPAITLAASPRYSFARRQSAEALNFQLLSMMALIVFAVIDPLNGLIFPLTLGWLLFTVLGGIRALQGVEFRNPVLTMTKFRPVKP